MNKLLVIFSLLFVVNSSNTFAQCAGCPTVNAQVNNGPTPNICLGQSITLTASNTPLVGGANTNSYVVTSIPYAPQPFTGGVVAVQNVDDGWGQIQTLPFSFCFYGNTYTQFVVGSNGVITFNTGVAGGYCPWPISAPWPNIVQINTPNDIGAPWRDIVTNATNNGKWYVSGVAPFRTAVIYWNSVPYFSCGSPGGIGETMQIILYETTSVVEVHIQSSQSCPWNSGAGIVGIQNAIPVGVIPPARNFPGAWSATNEAWRFSPMPAVPNWTWTSPSGTVGTGTTITVSPTVTTTYTAAVIPGCVGGTVQVVVNTSPTINPTSNSPICQGSTINLQAGGGAGNTTYTWTGPGTFSSNLQNPTIANAQPTASGVYSLTAANNFTNGPSCISSGTTLVNVVPVNQISVTPGYTLCQGANLNLTSTLAVTPTSYSWTGPNTFTSNVANPTIPNTMPIHAGNYTAVASFSTPGIPLVCTSSAVSNVSIVATSPVTVTMPANICEHFTANLTASANPTPDSYTWSGPNAFTSTLSSPSIPNITPLHTGIYNATAMWSIGSVSCTINGAGQINVVPVPSISINPPITVCYPSNVQLLSSSPGAISYTWTASNGFTSNIQSPLLAAPGLTASGIYTVTTAYTNGQLICYNNNTTQVTVNPIIQFSLSPYTLICNNTLYTIPGPAGATTYTWLGPNGFTSNDQVLSIPFIKANQGGTYTLNLSLGDCKTSGTTKVEVLSPIQFTNTPGNKIICKGDSLKLTMGSTGGSQNYAYVWNPQIYLSSPTGSVQYGQPQGTTIYNVTGYDIACPHYTISTGFTVTVNEGPKPDLQLAKFEGCEPLCLKYNSRTQEAATSITYDFGNGNLMQGDNFDYCLTEPGIYNLKINTRGKNGCVATYSLPAPIVVNPLPHTSLGHTPEEPTTTQNQVTFEPNALYGPVVSYLWQFKGAKGASGYDTSSAKNPLRIYDEIGKYPVMLISKTNKGCIDTVFKVLEIKDEFTIYIPNTFTPNGDNLNDVFNIKGVGLKYEGYVMEIYDRWGTLIYSTKDLTKGWDGTVKGILAENGVYVYKVKALGANGEGKKEYTGHVTLLK